MSRHTLFVRISHKALAILDAASERTGLSRAATVEVLLTVAGRRLGPADVPADLAPKLRGRLGAGRRKKSKNSANSP